MAIWLAVTPTTRSLSVQTPDRNEERPGVLCGTSVVPQMSSTVKPDAITVWSHRDAYSVCLVQPSQRNRSSNRSSRWAAGSIGCEIIILMPSS